MECFEAVLWLIAFALISALCVALTTIYCTYDYWGYYTYCYRKRDLTMGKRGTTQSKMPCMELTVSRGDKQGGGGVKATT